CAGQLAFLWPEHGGVLLAADAAASVFGLSLSPMYEDLDEGRRSLAKLASLDFEVACFGHGRPIAGGAAGRFRCQLPARRAGYVAIERVTGTLHGRGGSFVLLHRGTMNRGAAELVVEVVPDSGTGELAGLAGRMTITIIDGAHSYVFEYTRPEGT